MLQSRSDAPPRADSSFVEREFAEHAGRAMRSALQAHLRQPAAEETLRSALRSLSRDARHRDLRPEQLIVVLKQVWTSLDLRDLRDPRYAGRRQEVLDRMVTICIEEYYGS